MKNKEKLKYIYKRIWEKDIYDEYYIEWANEFFKSIYIWEILEYIESLETWWDWKDKPQYRANVFWLLSLYKDKSRAIDFQDNDCIDYVYNIMYNDKE